MQADRLGAVTDPGGGLGPGVEVPRQQPGDDLRLGGGVEVVQVQRVALPTARSPGLLAGAAGRRPRRGHVLPGSSRPPPSLSSGWVCRAATATPAARHTRSERAATKAIEKEMPAPRGVAHTPATSKVTKKMADQKKCVCV